MIDEAGFLDSLKYAFAGFDRKQAMDAAVLGCSISANAAFGVVDEVTRLPFGDRIDPSIAHEVLDLIESRSVHPISSAILPLARSLVDGLMPSVEQSLAAMQFVEPHVGQYAALAIAYMACDDVDGVADAEFNRILAAWESV